MAQKELELILTRQLAEGLAMPVFLVDAAGTMLFYNPPAEKLLGRRFEETGELPVNDWATLFAPTDAEGRVLAAEKLPLVKALDTRRPAHLDFWIRGLDQVARHIEVTALPLIGQGDRFLGAVAIFWEV
jgi:PAS domain-containing protein